MTEPSHPRRTRILLLIFFLLTVVVIVLLGWMAMNAVRAPLTDSDGFPDKPPEGYPDRFQDVHTWIRSTDANPEPEYALSYKFDAVDAARATAKRGMATLPWRERGPSNVGGRTRTIVVDANDPSNRTWFAGAISGGIWRTRDAGQSWEVLTDHWPTLSVSSIVQAPSNPDMLYAGTGEGFYNAGSVIGDGLFRSTDGGDTWDHLWATKGNPLFTYVNRLVVHPSFHSVVLAATNTGVYRTEDGGADWKAVLEPGGRMAQIAYEPGNFNNLYAAETGRGIWKSTDSGHTWALASDGLTVEAGGRVEFGISPEMPSRIIAMTQVTTGRDGIFLSDNRAGTWIDIPPSSTQGPDIAGIQGWYDMVVTPHPYEPNILFAGGIQLYRLALTGEREATFVSIDEEGTSGFLTFVNFGAEYLRGGLRLGTDDDQAVIQPEQMVSIELRFGTGRNQMAHRFTPPDGPGIAFADYPYADWVEIPFEAWDITNNRQLHVSFRDRQNDGAFNLIPREDEDLGREYILVHAFEYTPQAPHPQIATNGGLVNGLMYFMWPMLQDGVTWNPFNLPPSILRIQLSTGTAPAAYTSVNIGTGVHVDHHALVPIPLDANAGTFELISGNDGGVFHSPSGGSTWLDRSRGYNTTQFYGVDKKPGTNVYIGGMQDNGTYRSFAPFEDAVPGWTPAAIGGDGSDAVWHQQDPNRLIGGSQYNGLRRSVNGGISWQIAVTGLTDRGADNPDAPFLNILERSHFNSDILYAIGGSGVWRSNDFGASWQLRSIPEAAWGFNSLGRGTVRASPASASIVWAGNKMDPTNDGARIHVSTNNGASFHPVPASPLSPGRLSGLAAHPTDSLAAYALFSAAGRPKILHTTDLGQTWKDLSGFSDGPSGVLSSRGFPDVAVYDLLVLPGEPDVLWVGTEIGLFVSEDDGASWALADNGLPAVSIWRMRMVDDEVVLATHGRGVWAVSLNAAIATNRQIDAALPAQPGLGSAYPNPFTTEVAIPFDLARSGPVRVDIHDLAGRRVATLLDENRPAGRHVVNWRAEDMAAGTYLIRFNGDGVVTSKTVVRLR